MSRTRARPHDIAGAALQGLIGRPLRALLSATGIAIGIATIVAVLGISNANRSHLLAQIDALGTNLLTVTANQRPDGQAPALPSTATSMISRIGPVQGASAIGDVDANVFRSDRINAANTNAITVYSADIDLLATVRGSVAAGTFLTSANCHFPGVVLGADAAHALGVDRADGTTQLWLGGHWFTVIGVLNPLPLTPELDRSALIGFPIAEHLLHADGGLAEVYVRADPTTVNDVRAVLSATADPAAPQQAATTVPTDAITARADASTSLNGLLLTLGAIAVLVGAVGITNVMIISVIERRGEIGLRRSLGATRSDIALQFTLEATLLAAGGGLIGTFLGTTTTTIVSAARSWPTHPSASVALTIVGAALCVGTAAGTYPAFRAARLSPAEALRAT